MAALSTTFGVGELSAINAIAGAYAENLPIFHFSWHASKWRTKSKRLVHHTLGNGDFDVFYQTAQRLACAHTILTPERYCGRKWARNRSSIKRASSCLYWYTFRLC